MARSHTCSAQLEPNCVDMLVTDFERLHSSKGSAKVRLAALEQFALVIRRCVQSSRSAWTAVLISDSPTIDSPLGQLTSTHGFSESWLLLVSRSIHLDSAGSAVT